MKTKLLLNEFKKTGLNQSQIAKKCNISKSLVSRLYNGERTSISFTTAKNIIVGLGLESQKAMMIFFDK